MHDPVVWSRVVAGANPNSIYLLPSLRFLVVFLSRSAETFGDLLQFGHGRLSCLILLFVIHC